MLRFVTSSVFALALLLSSGAISPVQAQEEPGKTEPKPEPKPEPGTPPAPPRPGRPEGGPGGRGGRGGFGGGSVDRLADQLGLSDEQAQKLQAAMDEMREKMREAFQSGDREAITGLRDEMNKKIEGILTPEQKKKYDEMRSGMGGRGQGGPGGRGQGGPGGEGGRGGFGRGGQGGPGGRSDEALIEEVKKVLVLGKTEEETVVPAVKKVLESRKAVGTTVAQGQQSLLALLKEGATEEAVDAKVSEFRAARDKAEADVTAAQKALSDAVSKDQRAKLIALGLLR